MILKKVIGIILDLPNTILFNFRAFNFKTAIKLPVLVSHNIKLKTIRKGSININGSLERFMIKIGYDGAPFIPSKDGYFSIHHNGRVNFYGKCVIAQGARIFCDGGILDIESNVYINKNLIIQCEKNVYIGKNVLMGWNINIRDTDGHKIKKCEFVESKSEPIHINRNTWIASDVTILKGSKISEGSIVGCNSVVCGLDVKMSNSLVVGIPALVKRQNVMRKSD